MSKCVARCSIYEKRPKFCRDYPRITDTLVDGCTFYFENGERKGSCQPEVCQENACCNWPRENGDPEGHGLDSLAGGLPCKHLTWAEEEKTKTASEVEDASIAAEVTEIMLADLFTDITQENS